MNSLELTAGITAFANSIAHNICDDNELALLGTVITQLGDTIGTIAAQRALCKTILEKNSNDLML